MNKTCEYCAHVKKNGELCYNIVSCHLGCNKYCWVHAAAHRIDEFCSDEPTESADVDELVSKIVQISETFNELMQLSGLDAKSIVNKLEIPEKLADAITPATVAPTEKEIAAETAKKLDAMQSNSPTTSMNFNERLENAAKLREEMLASPTVKTEPVRNFYKFDARDDYSRSYE